MGPAAATSVAEGKGAVMGILSKLPATFWHLTGLLLALLLVQHNCLGNGFVWDDKIFLVGNQAYRYFEIQKIFFSLANGVEYLPVRDLSYALDYSLWGEQAWGFHLTNLALFALCACVAYLCSCRVTRFLAGPSPLNGSESEGERTSFLATLLFILHPIQSQAVNFITCRNVLLCGIFFFLSLYLFTRWAEPGAGRAHRILYPASLACFLLALFSKATAVSLPLLVVFLIFQGRAQGRKLSYLAALPFLLCSFGAFVLFKQVALQTKVMRFDLPEFGMLSLAERCAKAVQIPFFYLGKVFWPAGFAAEYDVSFRSGLLHPAVLVCLAALAVPAFLAWRWRGRYPAPAFGVAWFFITLLPVLNFFPTRPAVADRYAFLPVFGVFYLLALVLVRVLSTGGRRPAACAALTLFLFLGARSAAQCAVWKSEKTLWEDTVERSPALHKGYANLGSYYYSLGSYQEALRLFAKGEEIDPTKPDLECAEGMLAFRAKQYPAALGHFRSALEKNAGQLRALYFAGLCCEKLGDDRQAAHYLNLMFDSPEPDLAGYLKRSSLHLLLFSWPKIKPEIDRLRPSGPAKPSDPQRLEQLERAGAAYFYAGLYDDALSCYRELAQSGRRTVSLFTNQGAIHQRRERSAEAVACYRSALALQKDNAEALNRLGLLLMKSGDYRGALESFQRGADSANAPYQSAFQLAASYFVLGDAAKARESFRSFDARFPREKFRSVAYWKRLKTI
jgi:protein O-mannosyl-transferase